MTKRAAIYARYSSHSQRDVSIEIQLEKCREYADSQGWAVAGEYCDHAVSGRSSDRAQFQRMLDDAARGLFDVVVVWKATRIMRNRDEMAMTRFKLKQAGVTIEYAGESLPEGASGELMLAMLEALAEYESALMGERVADGMRKSAEDCRACGLRIFGYDVDETDHFVPHPVEAEAVRMAYGTIASGGAIVDVVNALSTYRTRRGNRFGFQSVKDMLQRPCYRGVYKFAGVEVDGGMPALVDDVTWFRAQEALGMKRVTRKQKASYVLTGRLRHSCGGSMVGVSGTGGNGKHCYYKCKQCGETVRKDSVEGAVQRALEAAFRDDASREAIADIFMEYMEEFSDTSLLDALRADLADVRARIERVWAAIENGAPGGSERLESLRERERDLLVQIDDATPVEYGRDDVMGLLDELAECATEAVAAPFVSEVVWDGTEVACRFVFEPEKNPGEPPDGGGSPGKCSGSPDLTLNELRAYMFEGGFWLVSPAS